MGSIISTNTGALEARRISCGFVSINFPAAGERRIDQRGRAQQRAAPLRGNEGRNHAAVFLLPRAERAGLTGDGVPGELRFGGQIDPLRPRGVFWNGSVRPKRAANDQSAEDRKDFNMERASATKDAMGDACLIARNMVARKRAPATS